MWMIFVIVVSVLYTLEDLLPSSAGSSGKGLSKSDELDLAEVPLPGIRKLNVGDGVPSSNPLRCNSSSAFDGGGVVVSLRRAEIGRELIVLHHQPAVQCNRTLVEMRALQSCHFPTWAAAPKLPI